MIYIGGPCVIESKDHAIRHAIAIKNICNKIGGIDFIYKSSYDKANRTSNVTYRGPGLIEGIDILNAVKREVEVKILTDVHAVDEVSLVSSVADIIQIPALLCRQTDLILAAAKTNRTINIKKGQFMDPYMMRHTLDKALSTGNKDIWLCERGTTFGYQNLVVDMRSIVIMKSFGCKVIMDAGHSVQQPGGLGNASGGMREMIPTMAKCGIAAGADGLFIEVHEDPDKGPSDGPNMLKLSDLEKLLSEVKAIKACL